MSDERLARVDRTLALLGRIHSIGSEPRASLTTSELSWDEYVGIGIAALETMLTGPAAREALQDWRDAYARDYAVAMERLLTVRWRGRAEAALELDRVEMAVVRLAEAGWTLARQTGLSGPWIEWLAPASLDPRTVQGVLEEAVARLAFSLAWDACGQAGI